MWIYLFDSASGVILSSRDFYSTIRVCRRFYGAAIRPLYRHVFWHNPVHFIASIPYLREESTATATTSLSISCSILPPSCRTLTIIHDGGCTETVLRAGARFQSALNIIKPDPDRRFSHFATAEVVFQMISIAKTFVHLEELSLTNQIISYDLHGLLRCISRLRVLEISSCHLEIESDVLDGGFVTSDCLQQLAFRKMTFGHKLNFSSLVSAPNLSSLSFDRTSGQCLPISELQTTFQKLKTLQVFDIESWTVEQLSPCDTMIVALAILDRSPALRNFSTDILRLSSLASSIPVISPASLQVYHGPITTLLKMMAHGAFREIKVLEITDKQKTLDSLSSFVSHSVQSLHRLAAPAPPSALEGLTVLGTITHIFFCVENFTMVTNTSAIRLGDSCINRTISGITSTRFYQALARCSR